jgi:hypothetical protein
VVITHSLFYINNIGNFAHRQSNDSAQTIELSTDLIKIYILQKLTNLKKNTTYQRGKEIPQVKSIVVDIKLSAGKGREASQCLFTTEFFCLSGDKQQSWHEKVLRHKVVKKKPDITFLAIMLIQCFQVGIFRVIKNKRISKENVMCNIYHYITFFMLYYYAMCNDP